MDETTHILIAARRRLSDPHRWTKGAAARDARGRDVHPLDPAAVRWCALGALQVASDGVGERYHAAVVRLLEVRDGAGIDTIPSLNDTGGRAAVLDLYDRAIRGK